MAQTQQAAQAPIGVGEGWRRRTTNEDVSVTDVWKRGETTMIRILHMSGMAQTFPEAEFRQIFIPQVTRPVAKTSPPGLYTRAEFERDSPGQTGDDLAAAAKPRRGKRVVAPEDL